jgi:hypothetical protein
MPLNECQSLFEPGEDLTGHCTAPVVGKTFLKVSGVTPGGLLGGSENIRVATAGAGQWAIGVAGHDQILNGQVPMLNGPGKVVPVTAGAAITAGDKIMSDATGRAVPWVTAASEANNMLGVALDSAANGADCPVRLYT